MSVQTALPRPCEHLLPTYWTSRTDDIHVFPNASHESYSIYGHRHGHGHGHALAHEHAYTLAHTTTKRQRPTSTSTNVAPLTHTHAPNTLEARVTMRHAGSDQAETWRTSSGFGIDPSSLPMHMQHQHAYTCAYPRPDRSVSATQ
jgi:hypothetical protein